MLTINHVLWGRVVTMTQVFRDVTVSHIGRDRWGCPLHCPSHWCLVCLHQFQQVLQCVAVRCSVLQCVAVRCSVLQCVAVRCTELQ